MQAEKKSQEEDDEENDEEDYEEDDDDYEEIDDDGSEDDEDVDGEEDQRGVRYPATTIHKRSKGWFYLCNLYYALSSRTNSI